MFRRALQCSKETEIKNGSLTQSVSDWQGHLLSCHGQLKIARGSEVITAQPLPIHFQKMNAVWHPLRLISDIIQNTYFPRHYSSEHSFASVVLFKISLLLYIVLYYIVLYIVLLYWILFSKVAKSCHLCSKEIACAPRSPAFSEYLELESSIMNIMYNDIH